MKYNFDKLVLKHVILQKRVEIRFKDISFSEKFSFHLLFSVLSPKMTNYQNPSNPKYKLDPLFISHKHFIENDIIDK